MLMLRCDSVSSHPQLEWWAGETLEINQIAVTRISAPLWDVFCQKPDTVAVFLLSIQLPSPISQQASINTAQLSPIKQRASPKVSRLFS